MLFVSIVYAVVQGHELSKPIFDIVIQETEPISLETEEIDVEPITLSKTNEAYLHDLINKGYDKEQLEEIYNFWMTCGEDISIIEDIYTIAEDKNLTGQYWVEESYNYATNQSHGVLDVVQVGNYLAKSISREQIQKASVLSRQGVYTITEILDKLLEGKTWSDLVNEVFGEGTVPKNAVNLDVEGIAKIKKQTGISPIVSTLTKYYTFEDISAVQSSQVIRSAYGDGTADVICVPKKHLGTIELTEKEEK